MSVPEINGAANVAMGVANSASKIVVDFYYRLNGPFYSALANDDNQAMRKIVKARGPNIMLKYKKRIALDKIGTVKCYGQPIALALLHCALKRSKATLSCVKELIRQDVNAATSGVWFCDGTGTDQKILTTLQLAAACEGDEYLKEMLDAGADINGRNCRNSTALTIAAEWDNFKGVRLLLSRGSGHIDVDAMDDDGMTALMWACINDNKDIAEALINAGASINTMGRLGPTAGMLGSEASATVGHMDFVDHNRLCCRKSPVAPR